MSELASSADTPVIRATYEEYDLDGTRVGVIADPENGHAWIQSTVSVEVVR